MSGSYPIELEPQPTLPVLSTGGVGGTRGAERTPAEEVSTRLNGALSERYRIIRPIGAGGMAQVFLAHDRKHQRRVAIKVLRPELSSRLGSERFLREIQIAASLTHPNILAVHDSGVAAGLLYYVMPYVDGESLGHRLSRQRRLPADEALRIAREVAAALDYAHRHFLVHRDIKPENILLADGHAVVADFGIARAVSRAGRRGSEIDDTLTGTGAPVGTPKYMSPEQAAGEFVDGRADVYSLGRVVYEMLVGETPIGPFYPAHAEPGQMPGVPSAHQRRLAALPQRVVRALVRSMALDRDDRFPTAGRFAVELLPPRRDTDEWGTGATALSALQGGWKLGAATLVTGTIATVALAPDSSTLLARVLPFGLGAVGIAIALMLIRGTTRYHTPIPRATPIPETSARNLADLDVVESIAVLPFVDMSPDADREYFSDGIAEEILNALAKIQGLRVAARTSSFFFKGRNEDVRRIGEALGVETVLEGSVRQHGARVRITAQLICAQDGFHLWSETYDRRLEDIFLVQQEIAGEIMDALRVKLPGGRPADQRVTVQPDAEAHNLYLKGRHLWNRRTVTALERAAVLFQHAIDRHPDYAHAHAGLADAYLLLGSYNHVPPTEALPLAKAAVERALKLDDTLAEAHATHGQILRAELDWVNEERAYRRAIQLNPSYATAHQWYATLLMALSRKDDALRHIARARAIDPLSPAISVTSGVMWYLAGHLDRAQRDFERTVDIAPDFFSGHAWLCWAHAEQGRFAEAMRESEITFRLNPTAGRLNFAFVNAMAGNAPEARKHLDRAMQDGLNLAPIGLVHAQLGEVDRAFECLERAFDEDAWSFFALHRIFLFYIRVGPWFDPMRDDPRFHRLLERMNMAA